MILIIILVVLAYLLLISDSYDTYDSSDNSLLEGFYTFNSRLSIDDQYFHDNLLDNAHYFPNEYNHDYARGETIGTVGKLGIEKCLQQCRGSCMEYGVTGNAYCYL